MIKHDEKNMYKIFHNLMDINFNVGISIKTVLIESL